MAEQCELNHPADIVSCGFICALLAIRIFYFWYSEYDPVDTANTSFIYMFPWITVGVGIWFLIAWLSHTSMINKATGSRPLERKKISGFTTLWKICASLPE